MHWLLQQSAGVVPVPVPYGVCVSRVRSRVLPLFIPCSVGSVVVVEVPARNPYRMKLLAL
jgi:hypothetical protein